MRQSGGDMGQSVCSRTTQHECCLLQSTTKGQSEPDIHEEFDAYLHQLGSFDAYLCPSGRFMSQMTAKSRYLGLSTGASPTARLRTADLRLSTMTLRGMPPKNSKACWWQARKCSMVWETVNST